MTPLKIVEFRYWPRWLSMRELGMTSRPNWIQRIIARLLTVLKGSGSVAASTLTVEEYTKANPIAAAVYDAGVRMMAHEDSWGTSGVDGFATQDRSSWLPFRGGTELHPMLDTAAHKVLHDPTRSKKAMVAAGKDISLKQAPTKDTWIEQTRPADTIDVSKVRWYGKNATYMDSDFRQHPWTPTLTNETRTYTDGRGLIRAPTEYERRWEKHVEDTWVEPSPVDERGIPTEDALPLGMSHRHLTEAVLEPIAEHTRPMTIMLKGSMAIDVQTLDRKPVHLFIDPHREGRILAYAGRKAPSTNEGET